MKTVGLRVVGVFWFLSFEDFFFSRLGEVSHTSKGRLV